MLAHRLRRWPNINPTYGRKAVTAVSLWFCDQSLLFAAIHHSRPVYIGLIIYVAMNYIYIVSERKYCHGPIYHGLIFIEIV